MLQRPTQGAPLWCTYSPHTTYILPLPNTIYEICWCQILCETHHLLHFSHFSFIIMLQSKCKGRTKMSIKCLWLQSSCGMLSSWGLWVPQLWAVHWDRIYRTQLSSAWTPLSTPIYLTNQDSLPLTQVGFLFTEGFRESPGCWYVPLLCFLRVLLSLLIWHQSYWI